MFLSLMTLLAFAEPQDIPSDTEESSTNQENDSSEKREPSASEEDESASKEDEASHNSDNVDTNANSDESQTDELTEAEYQKLIEEALQELVDESDTPTIYNTDSDEYDYGSDQDGNGYRGNAHIAYVLRVWNQNDNSTILHSYRYAGDPQYLWSKNDNFGPLLGVRFQLDASESLLHRVQDHIIGLTTGLQMGPVRLNTSGSYFVNHFFSQDNPVQNINTVTYDFVELKKSNGILWETGLTIAPEYSSRGVQINFGIPFQLDGDREMGALMESFKASALLSWSLWQISYELQQYPNNQIHTAMIGSGALF